MIDAASLKGPFLMGLSVFELEHNLMKWFCNKRTNYTF